MLELTLSDHEIYCTDNDFAEGESQVSHHRKDEYDPFCHLSRALFWAPDRLVVALGLTAYFDDSGTRNDRFMLVAGYIASVAQWERFNADWGLRLARHNLSWFRATDFAQSTGPFSSWKGKSQAFRGSLSRDLANIIKSYVAEGFVQAIDAQGWRRLNHNWQLEESRLAPYSLCGRGIVEQVYAWCKLHSYPENEVEFIFDDGSYNKGALMERLQRDLGILPIFRSDRTLRPLQAADWFAYEALTEIRRRLHTQRRHPPRKSLTKLLRVPSEPKIYRETDLLRLCSKNLIPLRLIT